VAKAVQDRIALLNGEIFYNPKEAQAATEQWRKHYNTIRLESALNYRPPAPLDIRAQGSPSR
jgi:hypothetical protein